MTNTPWYESDKPHVVYRGVWGYIILTVIIIALLSFAGWGISVLFANPAGRANAYKQQQSANNRVFAQQQFEDLYNDYQATVAKIPTYEAAAKNGDTVAQTNLLGLRSHCQDVVGQYNSASAKYLDSQFKTADLPPRLDPASCN